MYRIVYERHWSGCYHVRWIQKDITICVTDSFIKKLLNVDQKVLIGCCFASQSEMVKLGFLIIAIHPLNYSTQENMYGRIS